MSISNSYALPLWFWKLKSKVRNLIKIKIKESAAAPILMAFSLLIKEPRQFIRFIRDFYFWKRECHTAFRTSREGSLNQKSIVFIETIGNIYEAKLIAMLSAPFIENGWKVRVLSRRFRFWSHCYLAEAGIKNIEFWESYKLSDAERIEAKNSCTSSETKNLSTLSRVKSLTFQGVAIGSHLVGMASRMLRQGRLDLSRLETKQAIDECMHLAIENVILARHVISNLNPNKIVLIESNYNYGALVDTAIARGIEVIQFCQPARDDALIFKRLTKTTRRHHPYSLSPESLMSLQKLPWTPAMEQRLQQEYIDRYRGRWFLQGRNQNGVIEQSLQQLAEELKLDRMKKTAVVFSHVLWDANLFYGEDIFEDLGEWFIETVKAACKNPNVNWLIKLHPANVWKSKLENITSELSELTMIRAQIGELPSHVKLILPDAKISTWSLFKIADFGITVRGTTGIEMPCLGIHTLTAGTGRYSGLGFTNDSIDRSTYLEKLGNLQNLLSLNESEIQLAKKHAFGIFALRPWTMRTFQLEFDKFPGSIGPLNLVNNLRYRNNDENRRADLNSWYHWSTSSDADYIDMNELKSFAENIPLHGASI